MRRDPGRDAVGFGSGVVAGAGATLALFACRLAFGVPMPQEALAERIVRLLPYPVYALLLDELQHLAKPVAFATAVAAGLVGSGLGGAVYARATRASRRPRLTLGLAAAAATWPVLTYGFLPAIHGGMLGEPLTAGGSAPALPLAIGSLIYGLLLACVCGPAQPRIVARPPNPAPASPAAEAPRGGGSPSRAGAISRRALLRRSALMLFVAAAASRLGTWAGATASTIAAGASGAAAAAAGAFRLIRGMPAEVTPNGRFYQVSKNYPFDPTVDVAEWSLAVTGLVVHPLRLSYAEFVRAAPPVQRYQTLECISNEVGGDLVGNARWRGLRVADILGLAGPRPEATTIVWRSADGYAESVPLAVAMDPGSLLAYEMNGRPLPQNHGAPVRVLLLNKYGMKQPKWLTGIHVADAEAIGRWERLRLRQPAIVKTQSAFRAETRDGGAVLLGGWAFAGDRGIAGVEVSADGGRTWFSAVVKEALGDNCWQFWSATWTPPAPGEYALKVRAVDGAGATQPGRWRRMPDGAEGYHEIRVRVAG